LRNWGEEAPPEKDASHMFQPHVELPPPPVASVTYIACSSCDCRFTISSIFDIATPASVHVVAAAAAPAKRRSANAVIFIFNQEGCGVRK
jgi:hypothetical protein